MKIYYQWEKWAYSHITWKFYSEKLDISELVWVKNFMEVFENIIKWNLWIIPIENSYAGSIYENFFNLVKYDVEIYSEFYLDINHCLLSTSKNKNTIKKVFSHYQAIMQCEKYLENNWFIWEYFSDTAWSAKNISELKNNELWAIASKFAWEIYWLNILEENIEDQKWNTTRFFLVWKKWLNLNLEKTWKISLVFKTKDIPAVLYKCLWSFATRNINLSKIESLPAKDGPFEYIFWLDIEKDLEQKIINEAIEELKFFSKDLKILGDY